MTTEQPEETHEPLDEAFAVWWGQMKVEPRQKTTREEATRAGPDDGDGGEEPGEMSSAPRRV